MGLEADVGRGQHCVQVLELKKDSETVQSMGETYGQLAEIRRDHVGRQQDAYARILREKIIDTYR
jgi:hypothetical protein